ncbi:MAG: alpha/beta hydrolase [Candidatus Parcubacteria bacterium]|nr:alpha/beta hydrolase [Candidatus Parcubacteria bacterium]
MNDSLLQQKWFQTANGKICYYLAKQFERRPTVVLLHGLSANHTTWLPAIQKFQEAKFNVLALDLRGHGFSDKTKKRALYRLPVFSDDLDMILKKEDLKKIILIGYSFGGYVAFQYALSHPQSLIALVLVSANHVSPLKYRGLGFLNLFIYFLLNGLARLFFWQGRKNYYYFNQANAKGYWQSALLGLRTMPLTINFWMLSESFKINFSRDLEKITCPVLILRGRKDPFLNLKEALKMAEAIRDSKLAVLDESSHFLASRHQEKMTEAIFDFFREKNIL